MVDQVGDLEVDRGSILEDCHKELSVRRLVLCLLVNFVLAFIFGPLGVPIAAAVGQLFQDKDDLLLASAKPLAVEVVILSLHLEFLIDLFFRVEAEIDGLNKLSAEGQDANDLEIVSSHLLVGLNVGNVVVYVPEYSCDGDLNETLQEQ